MNRDGMLIEEIVSLSNGIEDKKMAMASLLKTVISIGCEVNGESCKNCPLTSYLCRQIHTQANLLVGNCEDCE